MMMMMMICIYILKGVCLVIIQASFVKDVGTLLIIFNSIFSSILVISHVSGSRF